MIGVSGDTVETQALFKKQHKVEYTLLADEKGVVAKSFGVPVGEGGSVTKVVLGKEKKITRGCTTSRWTFVVGKDSKIAYKNDKVKADKDAKSVLEFLEKESK